MNRLRIIRAEKRVTQFRLALLTGISTSRLSYFENDLIRPTNDEKEKLARALVCGTEELFPKVERGKEKGRLKEAEEVLGSRQ
jgi:transcriptional regulator with XRE-family HTH domain